MSTKTHAWMRMAVAMAATGAALLGGLAGLTACRSRLFQDGTQARESAVSAPGEAWEVERARRQHELDTYLVRNAQALRAFTSVPMSQKGIPLLIFRILPELFPELFGSFGADFEGIGMGKNPYAPDARLPLGFGYSMSKAPFIQTVTLTCGACHVGRVLVDTGKGAGAQARLLIGAPNTRADLNRFTDAVGRAVLSPKFTEENLRTLIDSKPAGWFYANPALELAERQIYKVLLGKIVKATREGIAQSRAHRDSLLTDRTYGARNGAMGFYDASPGRNDAFGLVLIHVLDAASAAQGPRNPPSWTS